MVVVVYSSLFTKQYFKKNGCSFDVGPMWGRCRVDVGSMEGRCGVDVESMWGRCRDDVGS